jgi:hypothetical protein
MRKPQREFESFILKICPEANPDNLKAFLKTLGDPSDHIGDEASRQTLKRSGGALIIRAVNDNLLFFP